MKKIIFGIGCYVISSFAFIGLKYSIERLKLNV